MVRYGLWDCSIPSSLLQPEQSKYLSEDGFISFSIAYQNRV